MKNRSSYAVLTRFGILGAILATLVLIAPAVFANAIEIEYQENGEDPVLTFSATDPDGGEIDWSLSGVDAGAFEIEGGVLTFKDSPDFESPTDKDEDTATSGDQGAGDNKYQITVVANSGEQAVEVKVTNVNEPGSVSFDQLQAQETRPLEADYDDDDKPKDPTWQWSRGPSADGPWTEITGATSADRTPDSDDIGNWLQATVSYTDSYGATSASGEIGPVVGETLANAAPSFASLDVDKDDSNGVQIELKVGENTKGSIGDPLTAKDADGDPRLYSITGGLDADCFGIGEKTGQLSLNAERDYEDPTAACETGGTARTSAADAARTADGTNAYEVEITATDPSTATGTATVTVTITDANEAAEFDAAAKADANVTLYIDENETNAGSSPENLELRQNEVDADETADTNDSDTAVANYTAADEDDNTALDVPGAIRYSVEGPDAKHFQFADPATAALSIRTGAGLLGTTGANFEDKNSYSIIIVATSGGTDTSGTGTPPVLNRTVNGDDRTRYATLAVTIKVVDQEDDGEVKFPHVREPQEGKSVLATHSDPDGGVTRLSWAWWRSPAIDGDTTDSDPALDDCLTYDGNLGDGTPASGTAAWAVISGASSSVYTPGSDTFDHDNDAVTGSPPTAEVGYCLRATATYTDDIPNAAGVMDMAHLVSERPVQADDPANTAPEFNDDQDPNTPGDQAVAERSVAENTKGKVGEPVVAVDKDLLIYAVDDTDNFSVDGDGQISTAVELDYEALPEDAKYYMVTLTATDPSGAYDTIMVKITVTDGPDNAIVVPELPPEFAAETAELDVEENSAAGMAVGDPVTATDPNEDDVLTYTLGGADAASFGIDAATGQISVGEGTMLDFESDTTSYSVTVTVTDRTAFTDSIDVTISVTDANDAPTFDAGAGERMIEENMEVGSNVGDPVAATDQDGDELTYSISESMYFEIDAATGQIATTAVLDYEAIDSHEVTVTVSDGEATVEVAVTIGVIDVEESACVLGGAISSDASTGLDNDCLTLLDLRDDLVGEGTELNWSAETPMSEWDGVSSGTGRVVSIFLRTHGLAGVIPAGFNDLDALEKLQLHDNDLTGGIPDLSSLDNLIWLILQKNSLSGSLPATLGDMDSLDYLYLRDNDFSGEIPTELAGVMTLRRVDLRDNDLTGEIPGGFGDIDRLRYLMLSDNGLSGAIPAGLGNAANMNLLYLADNALTGEIPVELGNVTTLRRLQLHNNMLTGDVPAELGNLSELRNLSLSGNMLTGCIPAAVIDAAVDADHAGLMACADDGS